MGDMEGIWGAYAVVGVWGVGDGEAWGDGRREGVGDGASPFPLSPFHHSRFPTPFPTPFPPNDFGAGKPNTSQKQWFRSLGAPKPHKNNGLEAWAAQNLIKTIV